jgi:hypothetical protein
MAARTLAIARVVAGDPAIAAALHVTTTLINRRLAEPMVSPLEKSLRMVRAVAG